MTALPVTALSATALPVTALPSLTVLGSINVDSVLRVPELPAPGETVLATERRTFLGGKGANQAVAAARLGAAVTMIGAVGADPDGAFSVEQLRLAGVRTELVLQTPAAPTGTAAITVDGAGENAIAVFPGANDLVAVPVSMPDTDVLLCQLEVDPAVVEDAVARSDAFVAINAAPARHLASATLERADLLVVNELEWAALPELARCRRVVVTAGSSGASVFEHGRRMVRVPSVRAEVRNTVGAGDAFTAAATIAFAAGLSAEDALAVAAHVGAAAVADEASQPALEPFASYTARAATIAPTTV
ncbi:PfkB family carbohydrate kinase [Curtobacterium sp. ZW137]|uniref:PfkB family carbohydrate kinase n=1 Tax=Curtobacterium sp. ZW137 TaxID=2485104 RepID=UPI000FBDB1E3|nr:PfkB family carbohydrate kinase [Curtobacterium sp. ZW137]ROP63455.1 ribokinase [Curtobacterium sp. ZW137]